MKDKKSWGSHRAPSKKKSKYPQHRPGIVAGMKLTKAHGQHFLTDVSYIQCALEHVNLQDANVLEIGPGSGILTNELLQGQLNGTIARLKAVEIDERWANYLQQEIKDPRFTVVLGDIVQTDWSELLKDAPRWMLISNLPYNVTFPVLYALHKYRAIVPHAIIMIQEEVAQKIVKSGGRDYGFHSLFFQWFFSCKLLQKVPPAAFNPPPKVQSRFIEFIAQDRPVIEKEEDFWKFIKRVFAKPRQTLQNNLKSYHYDLSCIEPRYLPLRAQQLTMSDFLAIWHCLAGQ